MKKQASHIAFAAFFLAAGCSGGAGPSASGAIPSLSVRAVAPSHRVSPGIAQGNDGSNWVTLANGDMLSGRYPIAAGKNALYYLANFSTPSDQDPQIIGTMTMGGTPEESYDYQPTCPYGPLNFVVYLGDVVFNHEGQTVVTNSAYYQSTHGVVWSFLSADGTQGACHTVNGISDLASGAFPMAMGPGDSLWGIGQSYLWKFAKDGSTKYFPYSAYPNGFGLVLVTQGPDGVMWGVQAGGTLLRINPANGKVLSDYTPPVGCAGLSAIATIGKALWGLASNCIFSVTSGGTFTQYQVSPYGAYTGAYPHGITQGPDGKPWFVTNLDGGPTKYVLGTVDPGSGKVTLYPLPNQTVQIPQNLVTGPDHNLWITVGAPPSSAYGDIVVYIPNPLSVSPSSVTLPNVGATQQITANQNGTKKWTAASQDPSIATVGKTKHAGVFTVKGTGTGSTTVTVQDKLGNSVAVPVTVQ
jgi:streptogramin lyase